MIDIDIVFVRMYVCMSISFYTQQKSNSIYTNWHHIPDISVCSVCLWFCSKSKKHIIHASNKYLQAFVFSKMINISPCSYAWLHEYCILYTQQKSNNILYKNWHHIPDICVCSVCLCFCSKLKNKTRHASNKYSRCRLELNNIMSFCNPGWTPDRVISGIVHAPRSDLDEHFSPWLQCCVRLGLADADAMLHNRFPRALLLHARSAEDVVLRFSPDRTRRAQMVDSQHELERWMWHRTRPIREPKRSFTDAAQIKHWR